MTLALDHPPHPDSPLARLDPRWKLLALAASALVAAALQTLPAAGAALLVALALAWLSKAPWRWYLGRLAAVGAFLLPFVILLPFLVHRGGPAWDLGPLRVSLDGARVALLVGARAAAVVTLTLVLLSTATLGTTLKAAHALRVPGLLVQLAVLTYRYAFVLADELARIRVALRVRGYRNRADRHSYRTAGHVAGTLLVRGYERAERVGQAMRCRGFDGRYKALAEFRTRPADPVAFALLISLMLGLLLWDITQR